MKIPLIKSSFSHEAETREALAAFIRSAPRFSMDHQCRVFETSFARVQERKFAVFVSSGSMANAVLVQALLNLGRLKRGDRVGVSAVTWPTNVMPLMQAGLAPVVLDCDMRTLNVPCSELEEARDLQAMFLTNALGFCSDLDRIREYCDTKEILLIEDNCESLGSRFRGKLLGNFGLASTFSFFVGHHLSTIEGGMICTDDDALYDMLILVRAHGWDRNLSSERQRQLRSLYGVDDFFARYTFYDVAFNARPTEISGFLGNHQLPFLEEIIRKREENFWHFQAAVAHSRNCVQLEVGHTDRISNFAMPVVCRSLEAFHSLMGRFERAGVEIRPIVAGNISQHPFFQKYVQPAHCPQASIIHAQGFYFPNNPELLPEEIQMLCDLLMQPL